MVCDTYRAQNETPATRSKTIAETVAQLGRDLASGTVRPVVGPQGAVTFVGGLGVTRPEYLGRNYISDACAFRRIMATGPALARAAIARAEALAGRSVDKRATVHSHDGGRSWEGNH